MNAVELKIGNLLRDKVTKTELKVIKLTEKDIVTFVIDRSKFPLQDGWGIEPIPLTEEWLLKFGFVEKIDAYFYNDYCIEDIHNGVTWVISEFDHITDEFTAIGCGIKYVHQLQNLYFALTGEELTFKSE